MLERLGTQRLLALFAAGWLLFNFPLLALWDHDAALWGLPLFPMALFGLWAALIAALAWVVERGSAQDPGSPDSSERQTTRPGD